MEVLNDIIRVLFMADGFILYINVICLLHQFNALSPQPLQINIDVGSVSVFFGL